MVGTSAPAGFPTRPYSALTIGGLFPLTDPGEWSDAALSHRQKAASLLESADAIRRAADGVPAEGQSGHTIDGFADASHRLAQTVTAHADEYFAMAGAAEEVERLIYGLREDLDNIDREANQEIQRVLSSGGGGHAAAAKVFIPPYLPHREENPSPDEPATVVIARSTQEAIVVNLPELYAL